MVSYGMAKARAMANRADWNERTEITKAVITWVDDEYDLEIENEYRMDDAEFTDWVEKNAESLQRQMRKKTEQPLRKSTGSPSKKTTLMTMPFLMRHTRQLANLNGKA